MVWVGRFKRAPRSCKRKHTVPACAYENDRWVRRVVFHVRISCILRVSLETQIDEVATSKSEDEQRDQEESGCWVDRRFQSQYQVGQRTPFKLHGLPLKHSADVRNGTKGVCHTIGQQRQTRFRARPIFIFGHAENVDHQGQRQRQEVRLLRICRLCCDQFFSE